MGTKATRQAQKDAEEEEAEEAAGFLCPIPSPNPADVKMPYLPYREFKLAHIVTIK
jgi:hypothetical protein